MPIRVHGAVEGEIKQVIVKRHNSGKWFACVCVEKEMNVTRREPKRAVGIDVGTAKIIFKS
jgi:transposase